MELVHSIDAHHKKCWSVSAHPTLPLIATASGDKSAKVFKVGGKYPELGHLEETHKRSVRTVAFKPPVGGVDEPAQDFFDLPAVAVGSFDSTISVWGIDEPDTEYDESEMMAHQKEILTSTNNQWSLMAIIEGHENEVKCVAWNWQGTLLASCSRDKTVWIWETDPETLEEFECVSVLNDHSGDVKHVAWHPRQDLLASSSYDDTIRIYREDDDDWECVGVLNGHEGTVWCSQFDPRSLGIRLVSVSDDMTARIWRTNDELPDKSGELPSSIRRSAEMEWIEECTLPRAHKYPIYSVAWSKTSGRIVTAGADGMLVVYEESDGKWTIVATKEYAHGVYEINSVTFAEADDGSEVIASGGDDGKVNVWTLCR
ncbi:hypothetical protein DIURU_005688 [Diutina rugosa]|uniref:Probable cytosolic iron-sulfur protein assembly protein 1 n=1 Tax=Diutina rugosa TaxID=5481 RepID=A0A642UCD6_DIURU|nr:uncharacterized protein DIURU_005688 [Diutina rugosa]KAA8896676.1 hypothetical protein DIURU_005688 [Diutina rugosa]